MFERFLPSLRKGAEPGTTLDVFDRMLDEVRRSPWSMLQGTMGEAGFAVDVSETDTEVLVKAEMPGFEPKDIDLTLRDNILLLKGEKKQVKEEKGENFVRTERSYGSFSRAIALPAEVSEDKVQAKYDKGILSIRLPKVSPSKAKKIEINA